MKWGSGGCALHQIPSSLMAFKLSAQCQRNLMVKSNMGKSGQAARFSVVASSVCQWALGQVSEEIFPSCKRIQLGNLILNALGAVVHVELRKEVKLVRLLKYWQKFTMGKSALIHFRGCCLYVYCIHKNQRDLRAKFYFDFPPNVPFEEDRSSFQVSFT